jgi:phosphoribosyl 1,2-cyclic phosphodiesterase
MRLKVLGSGSSGNCYILQGAGISLLLECGLPWKQILRGLDFNISNVAGCLVSHEHGDHSKAVVGAMNAGIDVYTSVGTVEALNISGWAMNSYRLSFAQPIKQFKAHDFNILPFEVEHDAAEPFGFLIHHPDMGKLLYITDSFYCKYRFTVEHIMIECNFSIDILRRNMEMGGLDPVLAQRLLKSHFSLENVKEFLMANDLTNVRDITLIHLSDKNSDSQLFKWEIEKLTGKMVYIASPGLEIEL